MLTLTLMLNLTIKPDRNTNTSLNSTPASYIKGTVTLRALQALNSMTGPNHSTTE